MLTNLSADEVIECDATNNPQDEIPTTRKVALTREVFIEADDFAEVPPPKHFRLKPGGEVRLKYACIIRSRRTCEGCERCHHRDPLHGAARHPPGQPHADKKVKGTIHWVSATKCLDAEVRLYDRLFTVPEPGGGGFHEGREPEIARGR